MEPTSTSFIPKKAIVENRAEGESSVSLFTAIIVIIFIVTAATTGAMFVYNNFLQKQLDAGKATLTEYQNRFSPEQILEMKRADLRLMTATDLLNKHKSPSQAIKFLQSITFKSVRFTSFSFAYGEKNEVLLKLAGIAQNYQYVGFQSDAFKSNKYVKEYMFSDFSLQKDGTVSFKANATLDKTLFRYDNAINTLTSQRGNNSTN